MKTPEPRFVQEIDHLSSRQGKLCRAILTVIFCVLVESSATSEKERDLTRIRQLPSSAAT